MARAKTHTTYTPYLADGNHMDCRSCSCTVDCDESVTYVMPSANPDHFFCSQACADDFRELNSLDSNYNPIED